MNKNYPKFYIQSGYDGKEVGALRFCYEREDLSFSAVSEYIPGQIVVGSVEFVEQYIGVRKPNYYPWFLKDYFYRRIWLSNKLDEYFRFVKPADRHKRFDAAVISSFDLCEYNKNREEFNGPYWLSELVDFTEEWRYYIADGEVLAAYWYFGEEKEIEPPKLNIKFPSSFCGAVDFGRLDSGEIALVENNLPYACGWYGPYSQGRVYGEWLEKGRKYLFKKDRNLKL